MFQSVDSESISVKSSGDARAIVVKQFAQRLADTDSEIEEIIELSHSAGASIVGAMTIHRSVPVAATYIGKGKLEELKAEVDQDEIDLVIFDHALSPIQERNIERVLKCRVLDRTGLILDIFSQRAQSSEGKLQVELAQLKYLSTRLVRGWSHLERQKGGIGLRGPGETQLETDRRLLRKRIQTLTNRLKKLAGQRRVRGKRRQKTPVPTVSLVGYTNAGKSTLFNRITGAEVLSQDQLFATLDPTMRRIDVEGIGPVILSDTVGFIKELPHSLVAAFKSTLDEVVGADCLLLVNDCSKPDSLDLRHEVEQVLDEIGAGDVPMIYVNNKIDLAGIKTKVVENEVPHIWLSAVTGEGLDDLTELIAAQLSENHSIKRVLIPPQSGEARALIYQYGTVLSESYAESGALEIEAKLARRDWGKLAKYAEITFLD